MRAWCTTSTATSCALQPTEVTEQRGELTRIIFIDAVDTYGGIEHEQARRVLGDGVAETGLVVRAIEPRYE